MPDHLHTIAKELLPRLVKAVERRTHRERRTEVVQVIEAVSSVCIDDALLRLVPLLLHARGVPVGRIADRRRDLDIVKEVEGGGDRYRVLHTIAPVLDQIALEDQILLGSDAVT